MDALTHSKKQDTLWKTAKSFMNQYYGYAPMSTTKKDIETWCKKYGWTPKELAKELKMINA